MLALRDDEGRRPPSRSLPQPGISLWCTFSRTNYGVQQCARFSRIAGDALPEDLVAAKGAWKLDPMPRPQEIQQAPVSLVRGDVDDIERDEPESARNLPNADVMEAVAPALGGPNPDDRAVLRDAVQRPGRSVKLRAVPLRRGESILSIRPPSVVHSRPLGNGAGRQKHQGECDAREQDARPHPFLRRYVAAEGSVTVAPRHRSASLPAVAAGRATALAPLPAAPSPARCGPAPNAPAPPPYPHRSSASRTGRTSADAPSAAVRTIRRTSRTFFSLRAGGRGLPCVNGLRGRLAIRTLGGLGSVSAF